MESWDREVDVLVVGTGAAGLAAAITAAEAGLDTLVIESTDKWGGSTNLSGGGLWMPTNPLMAQMGVSDTVEEALAYMEACIGDAGPASSPERRRAFVESVPEVFRFFERLGVRWTAAKDYPDYYPDLPGGKIGRAIEVEPFDVRVLGEWFDKSRSGESLPPIPLKTDDVWLLARAWSTRDGFVRGAQFVGRTLGAVARGKRLAGMGAGLAASLMAIVRRQGTPVLLESPLSELTVEDGVVTGAVSRRADGFSARIRARRAVVLAGGGFAHNPEMREKHHNIPGYSSAADGDMGTVIQIAADIGARLELMDDAWWGASVPHPGEDKPMFVLAERSMPFSIIVDQEGNRYVNESASYVDVGHAMLDRDQNVPAIPSWLIVDTRHRRRYLFSAFVQGGTKQHRQAGIVRSADTIEELAVELGMESARLRATVDRFNGFARLGVDEDFGRGDTAYDRYYSDPRVRPNPNLGPVEKGPFMAAQLVPGDLGTKGGLLTDEDGRVLDEQGDPIPGLYASGNTTASVMGRTYPGPGSTIAPAMIFSYRAARHAASRELEPPA